MRRARDLHGAIATRLQRGDSVDGFGHPLYPDGDPRAVADELHAQYLLGYAPPKRDGKVHKIDVRINGAGGLKPRARRSYVASKE